MTAKSTPAERKALSTEAKLAQRIAKLRKGGAKWDGEGGIIALELVKGAPQGRALLRKHGLVEQAGGIASSWERTPEWRAAESERRTANRQPVAKPVAKTGRKAAPRAKASRRARKVA